MEEVASAPGTDAGLAAPQQPAASDAAPAAAPSPAPQQRSRIPSFAEAFPGPTRADAVSEQRTGDAPTGTPESGERAQPDPKTGDQPRGSAQPGAADASKPGDAPATDPPTASETTPAEKKSRGQAAHDRHEQEKAQLRAQLNELLAEREERQRQDGEQATREQASRQAYLQAVGSDEEYDRRTRIANQMFGASYDGPRLTQEEADELARWTTTREFRRYFEQDADARATQRIQAQERMFALGIVERAKSLAALPAVDPEIIKGSDDFAVIGQHLHAAGAASRDAEISAMREQHAAQVKELQDAITRLQADITDARSAAAARPPVPTGGRTGTGRSGSPFDPKAPASDNWRRVFGAGD